MKVYFINYQWEQMTEAVYEYLISECEKFFYVKNDDRILFHVESSEREKTLIVAVMYDEIEQYFIDNIQDLTFTDFKFARIFHDATCSELQKSSGCDDLPDNEIRYLKLHHNDIISLFIMNIAQTLKMKKYYSVMKQNGENRYVIYIAKQRFDLTGSKQAIKFADITEKVV